MNKKEHPDYQKVRERQMEEILGRPFYRLPELDGPSNFLQQEERENDRLHCLERAANDPSISERDFEAEIVCQHMLIHGKQKHYCNLEPDHEGEWHKCECGDQWRE